MTPHNAFARSLVVLTLTGGLALAQSARSAQPAQSAKSNLADSSACLLPGGPLPERSRYVLLLDISGSMQGKGDGEYDIFAQVKQELGRFLAQTTGASTVRLVTFSQGVAASRDFQYPEQRAEIQTYLSGLKATGERTYLYRAMQNVFSKLRRDSLLATTVYVLTDGQDNDPKPVNLRDALGTFERSRGAFDKLYYLGLGTRIPQAAVTAFATTPYARTLEVPARQIPQLGGFGLLPALLELSDGQLSRRSKLGEDVTLKLDASRFPGLKLGQERQNEQQLTRGEATLRLSTDAARRATDAALLCVEGQHLSERALIRNGQPGTAAGAATGSAAPAGDPALAAPLRLTLLNPEADRVLAPGQQTTLNYRLDGPAGQQGTVDFGQLPTGLTATLNGQALKGPLTVATGTSLALTLRNAGLAAGTAVRVAPQLTSPGAATAGAGNPGVPAQSVTVQSAGAVASGPLRLTLLNPADDRTLGPGEQTTLNYRLDGPAGQQGTVDFGSPPAGLQVTLNGQALNGPLTVASGTTLALTLRNAALVDGAATSVAPTLNGTAVAAQTITGAAAGGAAGTGSGASSGASAGAPVGRVVLLNPGAAQALKRGESTLLRYRAEGGPATVQLGTAPAGARIAFEGQPGTTLTAPAGGEFAVRVTNDGLAAGSAVQPDLRLASGAAVPAPTIRAQAAGFDWNWLGLLGLLGLLPLLFRRRAASLLQRVPVAPAPVVTTPSATLPSAPTPSASMPAAAPAAPLVAAPDRLELREERLSVEKERYVAGQVEVGKRVETRTETAEVELEREQVVIERRAVEGARPVDGAVLGAADPVRIALEAERASAQTQTYVAEEVEVGTRETRRQETLSGTVGKEVLDVRRTVTEETSDTDSD